MSRKIEFIKNAGACIASKNILEGKGKLCWCIREESENSVDNGWRFLSHIDTDEFLNNPANLCVCDYNTVAEIEPAIIAIYTMPVGTDIMLVRKENKLVFVDSNTEEEIKLLHL